RNSVSSFPAKIEASAHFNFFTFDRTNSSQQAFLVLGFLGATLSFSQLIRDSLKTGLDMLTNLISLVSVLKKWNKEVYRYIATRKCSLPRRIKNVQAALDHKCSKFLLELEMDLGFEYEKVIDEEDKENYLQEVNQGLVKKVRELTTLFGIEAFAIVYSPDFGSRPEENCRKELNKVMLESLSGKGILQSLNSMDLNELGRLVKQNLTDIDDRARVLTQASRY
ncbi:hypothetical protein Godav_001345, partial [Gossypium davidsonii]|nr:hypothetical protein [Gossypium davidsonii]